MALPAYSDEDHDVGLGAPGAVKGWMRLAGGQLTRGDAIPGTARSASGESRFDIFTQDAFIAQADYGGGVGQARFVKSDTILSGLGDGRFQGHYFPARAAKTAYDGGSTSYLFTRAGVLYGVTDTHFETITDSPTPTTQYARTSGTMYCQPVETGAQNIMWVQDDGGVRKVGKWAGPGGAFSFVTPPGITPYVVCPYGRVVYCIGQRTLAATSAVVQSNTSTFQSATPRQTMGIQLNAAPRLGNVLVARISYPSTSATVDSVTAGWQLIAMEQSATSGGTTAVYYRVVSTGMSANGTQVAWLLSAAQASYLLEIHELTGLDTEAPLGSSVTNAGSANPDTSEILAPVGTTFNMLFSYRRGADTNHAVPTNYTELVDINTGGGGDTGTIATYYRAETTDQGAISANWGSSGAWGNVFVSFRCNALTTDLLQTVFLFTRDDGTTWELNFQGDSAGIGAPKAAFAAGGAMWVTTANKFYKVVQTEQTFADQLQTISLAIDDVDRYSVPFVSSSVGHVIDTFSNFIYYPVGGTIREHAPGSQTGRQFWPPASWDTTAGTIQGMVAGEGFLAWVAGGYLWATDGRGVFCLASEPAANAGDTLFWHAGRLYMRGDPVRYWDFKDPSTRPDISYPTTVDNFTDGYIVMSAWDAEKVDEIKICRELFLQAEWTATSNSGTLTLAYLIGDSGIHPERIGGGVTSGVTWTTIGTMTVADGNNKRFTLSTPIEFKKLYLRVKIEVGSAGYPIVEAVGANGRTKMPDQLTFVLPLDISTSTRNRKGELMYPTAADVREAVLALRAMRNPTASPYYQTLQWTDGVSDNTSFLVTVDNLQEIVTGFLHDNTLAVEAYCNVTELPG